ncbi:unnamed protein product [Heligmosomoides polygyrus]|uniref:HECT-type E3 ubiquitin transferase n=1 Tax=Heligmosomoides polygyrus TaxID=6339 RepID=A0A3P8CAQ3_HELPZ|nr:unnamed protein product [Heligmosomoides polygyrus]
MSFLNLVDFDGSIKRNKKQEAVLSTFNDRERFLRELEAQRKARAVDQRQQKAAKVVQRSWRTHKARSAVAQQVREQFDEIGRPTTKEMGFFDCLLGLIAKLTPYSDGQEIAIASRLSPRLESLCEQLMLPALRIVPSERIPLCEILHAFGRQPSDESMPAGTISTYFLSTFLDACYQLKLSDEDKFMLLSTCAGYKQEYQKKGADEHLPPHIEAKVEEFMVSSINKAFDSPMFSTLCRHAAHTPTDENVWSLVTFERKIVNSDMVMLLATSSSFMNRLWQLLVSMTSNCSSGRNVNQIDLLKMGHPLEDSARDHLTQALSLFCGCLVAGITSVDDADFATGHPNLVFSPAKLTEIVTVIRDVGLGLIDLAFPEDFFVTAKAAEERTRDAAKSLYAKDSRVHFLPSEFWSNHRRQVVVTRRSFLPPRRRGYGIEGPQRVFTPFSFVRFLHERPEMESDSSGEDEPGPSKETPATSADLRNLSIIKSIPFVVPFMQRVKIFQDLLSHDREANDIADDFHGFAGPSFRRNGINIAVRRQHLYEDAFEALSLGNAPNLRLPIRVSMTNWVGLNEVGIDGGGIFREFLTELLRTGFDPDRGFFKYTHDRYMVSLLIYEKQMAEIRFAEFFVSQLLGKRHTDVDLHHLKSYDPAIYKHLKNLRNLSAKELQAIELDFSVIVDDVGDVQSVDLVPGGRNIRVTVDNRLEYIRAYVNFFLFKRVSV